MRRFLSLLLCGTITLSLGSMAFAEEKEVYDYPNKYLWYEPSESYDLYFTDEKRHAYDVLGWEDENLMDNFINSQLGESVIDMFETFIKYPDEMGEEILAYWENIGIKKEMHEADNQEKKWASYVPLEAFEKDSEMSYPVVVVIPGGTDEIYTTETFGFAEVGAQEGFITIASTSRDADVIVEMLEEAKKMYPVDASRIYCTGYSGGGLASKNVLKAYPKVFAGIASGGTCFSDAQPTEEEIAEVSEFDIPLLEYIGTLEGKKVLPIAENGKLRTGEEKVSGFNAWCRLLNIDAEPMTVEDSLSLSENSKNLVEKTTGIEFTDVETEQADGTNYYIGNLYNEEGINTFRVVAIEGGLHWPTGHAARMVWDFFKQYSRDTETGELLTIAIQ